MTHPAYLPLDELKPLETELFTASERPHWSEQATFLGRVTDEHLYSRVAFGQYATPEAYAKDRLDLTGTEFRLALLLWRTMQWAESVLPPEKWTGWSKAKALLLSDIRLVGGTPEEWIPKARDCKTGEFRQLVDKRLEREVTTDLTFRHVPLSTVGLVQEALEHVLDKLVPEEQRNGQTPAEMAQSNTWRVKGLEALVVQCLQPTFVTSITGG